MRNYPHLIVILCTFLFSLQIKAQKKVKFKPDSIPSVFSELKTNENIRGRWRTYTENRHMKTAFIYIAVKKNMPH